MEWQKYWKAPFRYDEFVNDLFFDSENNLVIQNADDDVEVPELLLDNIIEALNGEPVVSSVPIKAEYDNQEAEIIIEYKNNTYRFMMRGWGMLIGTNKLSNQAAAEIQDGLAKYIISRLTHK